MASARLYNAFMDVIQNESGRLVESWPILFINHLVQSKVLNRLFYVTRKRTQICGYLIPWGVIRKSPLALGSHVHAMTTEIMPARFVI